MRVLFVCTGNTCRSPMAEAIMRKMALDAGWKNFSCASAGLCASAGAPISAEAGAVMRELYRIPPFSHAAVPVTPDLIRDYDLIVTMTAYHKAYLVQRFGAPEKCVSMPFDVGDPYGGGFAAYAQSARGIEAGLKKLVESGVIHE